MCCQCIFIGNKSPVVVVIHEKGAENNNLGNKNVFKRKGLKRDKSKVWFLVMLISSLAIVFIGS